MRQAMSALILALLFGEGLPFRSDYTQAETKKNKEIYVVSKVQFYEVEESLYTSLQKAKRLSKEDLEKLELQAKQPKSPLDNLKPVIVGTKINLDEGQQGELLRVSNKIKCLPSPEQLRQGKTTPQVIHDGVTLRAQVQISADRRFVRAKLIEKSVELEGTEKFDLLQNQSDKKIIGEVVFLKELESSLMRDVPDGGTLFLPLHYRTPSAKAKGRYLVAQVEFLIYIEAEEREKRRPIPKKEKPEKDRSERKE